MISNRIKPISLSLMAFLLSLVSAGCHTVGRRPIGQKDVKGEAAEQKLIAAMNANTDWQEKCNDGKWIPNGHGINVSADPECRVDQNTANAAWAATLDCMAAVIDRHNREFPSEPWAPSDTGARLFGKPGAERLEQANACVDHGGIIQP